MMFLHLQQGYHTPDENQTDPGIDGPCFGPCLEITTTAAREVSLYFADINSTVVSSRFTTPLPEKGTLDMRGDGTVYYDGRYYVSYGIVPTSRWTTSRERIGEFQERWQPFDQSKTTEEK